MSSSLRLTKLAMVVGRLDKSLSGMLSFFKAWQLKSCCGNTEEGKQWNIIILRPISQSNSLHLPLITSLVPHYLHLVLTPLLTCSPSPH
ncbi:hypothetical protein EYF80_051808 [Liparis tanakae]|uniref:Uncharacterized protein n=1 Tax=Liparis tanakae TaxID=230148 RepID=A0A4Z2FCA5_9TELE|nr:hypothetical protein EYF80_051808 [Liparis tanakae]